MAQHWNRILAGVDGSPTSRKAVEWASDVAVQHGSELLLLTAWLPTPPPLHGVSNTMAVSGESSARDAAEQLLRETVRDLLGDDPPIRVVPMVKEGSAAKLLIEQSSAVDLLVVGSRGYGGFVGMLLGSVSQHVAAHASCTVVVVR